MATSRALTIAGVRVLRGETRDVRLKISETYTGDAVTIPLRVVRGPKAGPTVFVTAAVHGDELNGTGIVHDLMFDQELKLKAGTLLLAPAINVFGLENHVRYLPDRRDLNRAFPGSEKGSLASRIAAIVMREIIGKSDFGIDLHSASFQRTNFPNIRGNLNDPAIRRLARAFGCELLVHGPGPVGSLRREASKAGCPTIILEAGEPFKMEPTVVELGRRGVYNVLIDLGMMTGVPTVPPFQTRADKTKWVRAEIGGILRFHVMPGGLVRAGDVVATNYSLFGLEQNALLSPVDGIVLSVLTLPAVKPGEPVCHIAVPGKKLASIEKAIMAMDPSHPHVMLRNELASGVSLAR